MARGAGAARPRRVLAAGGDVPSRASAEAAPAGGATVRVEVTPPWPFRLGGGSLDGLFRRRGGALQRLVHVAGEPVLVGAAQPRPDRVVLAARAPTADAALEGVRRMRFALGVDADHADFHARFRSDRFIGRAVRTWPHLRVRRRPDPWEALAWAVTEQLVEFERAVAVQRRLIAALGRRCPRTGLRDAPTAAALAAVAPARLASFDLAGHRAITLRRVAIAVARGRVDLHGADHEAAWRRLRAIPGVGPWTVEMLALQGQGRYDHVPAGDAGFLRIVGRLLTGRPRARAGEDDVRAFFERYGSYKGLAGEHLRMAAAHGWLVAG